jgi:hypothetical protein
MASRLGGCWSGRRAPARQLSSGGAEACTWEALPPRRLPRPRLGRVLAHRPPACAHLRSQRVLMPVLQPTSAMLQGGASLCCW